MSDQHGSLPACPAENQLDALSTGELDPALLERVTEHVAACDACRERKALFERGRSLGAQLRAGRKDLAPVLRHRLLTAAHSAASEFLARKRAAAGEGQ